MSGVRFELSKVSVKLCKPHLRLYKPRADHTGVVSYCSATVVMFVELGDTQFAMKM